MPPDDQSNHPMPADSQGESRVGLNVDQQTDHNEVIPVEKFSQSLPKRLLKRVWNLMLAIFWKARLGSFGRRSRISVPAWIKGHQSIHVGENVHIWRMSRMTAITPHPSRRIITIDDGSIIHPSVHISAVKSVHVAKNVLIAANCYITDHDHMWQDIANPPIRNGHVIARPTRICDEVWLGEKVMVLKGVTIGRNSIIGSGSVVTKDVPPFSMAVGNPARVIRTYDHDSGTWRDV